MEGEWPYQKPRYLYKGEVYEAMTTTRGLALRPQHQSLADAIVEIIQEGCRWFYEQNPPPMMGVPEVAPISDERIDDRLRRYDWGENLREARRYSGTRDPERRYHLLALPPDRKRAVIEQIDYLLMQVGFRWVDNPARVRIFACPLCRGTVHTERFGQGRHWWAAKCRTHDAPILVWRYHWIPNGRTLAALEKKYRAMFPKVGELRDYPLSNYGHVMFHPKEAEPAPLPDEWQGYYRAFSYYEA